MKNKKLLIIIGVIILLIITFFVIYNIISAETKNEPPQNKNIKEKTVKNNISKFFKGFSHQKQPVKQEFEKEIPATNCNKTEEEYIELTKKEPHNDINYFCIAEIYKKQEHFQKAIENYQIAYNIKPEQNKYLKKISKLDLKLGQHKKALENIAKLLLKEPDSAELHFMKCQALTGENHFKEALLSCNKAEQLSQNNAEIYYQKCKIKTQLNENHSAAEDCYKAISINPNNPDFYAEQCLVEFKNENFKKSIENCEKAITKGSKNAEVYYNMGHINFYEKNYKSAIENLDKAIDINPNHGLAYLTRCQTKIQLKEYQDAYADCEMAINLHPNILAYSNKAQIEYELQNYANAISDCDTIINAAKDYPDAYLIRGKAYLITGEKKKAKEDLQTAQKIFLKEDNIEKYEEVTAIMDMED